jgi:hypothetical protein
MTYLEFDAPKDFIAPEGISEGESFEEICTLKLKANGKLCLVKLGDAPLDDGKDDHDEDDSEAGFKSRITDAFKNRGGG